jgi:hypothetical protein
MLSVSIRLFIFLNKKKSKFKPSWIFFFIYSNDYVFDSLEVTCLGIIFFFLNLATHYKNIRNIIEHNVEQSRFSRFKNLAKLCFTIK